MAAIKKIFKFLTKDRTNMDPAAFFPVEITEMIFHHLNGNDLLSCTLVDPTWNDHIGESLVCMNKIILKLGYDDKTYSQNLMKAAESNRKYRHIRVSGAENIICLQPMMKARGKWKSVLIEDTMFPTTLSFYTMLRNFSETVTILMFINVHVDKKDFVTARNLTFPKLKHFQVEDCDEMVAINALAGCDSLETVLFCDSSLIVSVKTFYERIIIHQTNLRCLEICGRIFDLNISDDIEIPFQLEKLGITDSSCPVDLGLDNYYRFVRRLLRSQKYLKDLLLGDSVTVPNLLLDALQLTSLNELAITNYYFPVHLYYKNNSIKVLKYYWPTKHNREQMIMLLNVIRNPKTVSLIAIKTEEHEGNDIQDIFPRQRMIKSEHHSKYCWIRKDQCLIRAKERSALIKEYS